MRQLKEVGCTGEGVEVRQEIHDHFVRNVCVLQTQPGIDQGVAPLQDDLIAPRAVIKNSHVLRNLPSMIESWL